MVSDLPEKFKFEDLQEKEVIGRGSYGIVYKARHHDKTVVVKNVMGESAEDEKNFVKEAKLLRSLQHSQLHFNKRPGALHYRFEPMIKCTAVH